jgi:hypothetical protein
VSLPLLAHDLGTAAPALLEQAPLRGCVAAGRASRIWSTQEDDAQAALVNQLRSSQPAMVQRLFDRNRYAEILYDEYRCCAVHGLELGWKTGPAIERDDPGYMNYQYGADDRRPPGHRYRTRIVFPLSWLAGLLREMTVREERACIAAGWPFRHIRRSETN